MQRAEIMITTPVIILKRAHVVGDLNYDSNLPTSMHCPSQTVRFSSILWRPAAVMKTNNSWWGAFCLWSWIHVGAVVLGCRQNPSIFPVLPARSHAGYLSHSLSVELHRSRWGVSFCVQSFGLKFQRNRSRKWKHTHMIPECVPEST